MMAGPSPPHRPHLIEEGHTKEPVEGAPADTAVERDAKTNVPRK